MIFGKQLLILPWAPWPCKLADSSLSIWWYHFSRGESCRLSSINFATFGLITEEQPKKKDGPHANSYGPRLKSKLEPEQVAIWRASGGMILSIEGMHPSRNRSFRVEQAYQGGALLFSLISRLGKALECTWAQVICHILSNLGPILGFQLTLIMAASSLKNDICIIWI